MEPAREEGQRRAWGPAGADCGVAEKECGVFFLGGGTCNFYIFPRKAGMDVVESWIQVLNFVNPSRHNKRSPPYIAPHPRKNSKYIRTTTTIEVVVTTIPT